MGLDEAERHDFERRGCQHVYTQFGFDTAKQFMDPMGSRDAKALISRHNNKAGRLAVKNHMEKKCRCHGLSQTCQMKTCWWELPAFRSVSDRIKTHFDGAVKVYVDNKGERIIAEESTVKPPTEEDLVYTTRSPDFCNSEYRTGSLGTRGRTCNETSQGTGGCELLCCGRGYERTVINEEVNCRCRFHWCCEVRCKKCKKERVVFTCK
ncbi:predicted protein [Nematostella vectensis]|uniref:Protein Wnt n=3 Tax=Nematostella vectensis TaxID=45351 RepID=A7SFU3_NEMVE|nr:predicted protein [Nematostella vectensis]|eukprot:XP_001629451.1 predicted protein [Nematostella vectensis]